MGATLRKEFSVRKLSLNVEDKNVFRVSWILPPWAFLALRLTMALFCMVIVVIRSVQSSSPKLFIYLTIWSYLLLTLNFVTLSVVSLIQYFRHWKQIRQEEANDANSNNRSSLNEDVNDNILQIEEESTDRLGGLNRTRELQGNYGKLIWLLWVLSANSGLIVTLLFWTIVFRSRASFLSISLHAVNSVFIFIEVFTNSIPVNLLHCLYVMILAGVYSVFTVVYWAAGGLGFREKSYIYKVIDYETGNPALIAGTLIISVFVVTPVMQLFLFGLYQLRRYIRRRTLYPDSDGRSN